MQIFDAFGRVRRLVRAAPVLLAGLGFASLGLAFGASGALAASAGCDAVNAGVLNSTVTSPSFQTYSGTKFTAAAFTAGEILTVSYSASADAVARFIVRYQTTPSVTIVNVVDIPASGSPFSGSVNYTITNIATVGRVYTAGTTTTSSGMAVGSSTTYVVTCTPVAASAPSITSLAPTSGPQAGGTSVVITGTGFTGASAVNFGSTAATGYTVNSDTQITATAPAGSGAVDVLVTTGAGTNAAGTKYTYTGAAPTVTALSPTSGASGTSVTITGTNFTNLSTVKFGTSAATSATYTSATQLTAVAPAGTGIVDVTVTESGQTSATSTSTKFTYLSNVATLSSLVPSAGTLSPTFASGTTGYTASVANSVSSITVTPTVTNANATVKVNGTTVASGSASGSIALNVGSNTITTVVTAQDGTTTQTYTLTVTRAAAASTVATLSSLVPSAGTLSPTFASGTTGYTASVGNAVSSLTLTPTVTQANATVTVNGTTVASGSASGSISLSVGSNTITTIVTAQDGTTTQTYTLTVTREMATSTVTLTATPDRPDFGKPVVLRAAVTPASATGTIAFRDGSQTLGSVALSGGVATLTMTQLSLGDHQIVAAYSGDMLNTAATSAPAAVTTQRPDPSKDQRVRQLVAAQQGHVSRLAQSVGTSVMRRLEDLHDDVAPFRNGITLTGRNDPEPGQTRQIEALREDLSGTGLPMLAYAPRTGSLKMPRIAGLDESAPPKSASYGDQSIVPGFNVWTAGSIVIGRERVDSQVAAMRSQMYLVTIGADRALGEHVKAGVSVSLAREEARLSDDTLRNDAQSKVGIAYVSWRPFGRVFVDGMIGFGDMRFDTSRLDSNAGGKLSGKRPASLFLASLALGAEFRSDALRLSPYLRYDRLDAMLKAYSETGDADWALAFDRARMTSSSIGLGMRTRYDFNMNGFVVSPTVRTEVRGATQGVVTQTLSYVADPSVSYETLTRTNGRFLFTGGLGVQLDNKSGLTTDLEYLGFYNGSRMSGGGLRGRLGLAF